MDTLVTMIKSYPEVKYAMYDILRLLTIQIFTQFMISVTNSSVSFLTTEFIQTTMFLSLGSLIFWLILYKMSPFREEDNVLNNSVPEASDIDSDGINFNGYVLSESVSQGHI